MLQLANARLRSAMNMPSPAASLAALATAISLVGVPAVRAQDATKSHPLAVGKPPSGGLTASESGSTWRLVRSNKADQIHAAYRYGDNVIFSAGPNRIHLNDCWSLTKIPE